MVLPMYGKGKNSRELLYVTDHCQALLKVFQYGQVAEFYNIGSNQNFKDIDICKTLLKMAKKKINIGSNVKANFVKDRLQVTT